MTDHFEVHARDGAARIGELRLSESLRTPGLVGEYLDDAGSEWAAARETPAGDPAVLTVLPHRSLPPGTPDEVRSQLAAVIDAGIEHPVLRPVGDEAMVTRTLETLAP
jgi:archaeosine synthase